MLEDIKLKRDVVEIMKMTQWEKKQVEQDEILFGFD
jgi:hypothetical protein